MEAVTTPELLSELKSRMKAPPQKNIILVGPPGSGKGTQVQLRGTRGQFSRPLDLQAVLRCARVERHSAFLSHPQAPIIKEKYHLCHLATGDLLRAAVAAGADAPPRSQRGCSTREGRRMGRQWLPLVRI